MEWVASTLHTTSEHGVSSITTADAHTLAVSSRKNWGPRRFKWTRPFRHKTKSGFCVCAVTFRTQSNISAFSVSVMIKTKHKQVSGAGTGPKTVDMSTFGVGPARVIEVWHSTDNTRILQCRHHSLLHNNFQVMQF